MFALLISVIVALLVATRFPPGERRLLMLAFILHLVAAVAQVVLTTRYFGGGDMMGYFSRGTELSRLLLTDFARWAGPVTEIALGGSAYVPVNVLAMGSSTGAMSGLAAWALVMSGGSIYGACFIFATFAYLGQCAIARVFTEAFPPNYRRRVLLAAFFVPSVVFWSSGILKEAVALGGLGICLLGVWRFVFTRSPLIGIPLAVFGGFALSISKPYTLFPLVVAIGAWFYWTRRASDWGPAALLRNIALVMIAAVAAGYGAYYLGELYPKYAFANVSAEAANLQGLYYRNETAGSTYEYGEATEEAQLSYAPFALLSALARPVLFEVHNIVSLIAAVEMTALLAMIAWILRRDGFRQPLRTIVRSPIIVFLFVFVVLFGVGVGLGSPNIGSLSRYRILMMPFYVLGVAALLPPARTAA